MSYDIKVTDKTTRTLESLPTPFIECRRRHDWQWAKDDQIVLGLRKAIVQHTEHYVCPRCGATKSMTLDSRTGEIIKRSGTRYPEYGLNYRVTHAEVRVEGFRRRMQRRNNG